MGDVVACWGSTYLMISRILEQQQALSAVLAEDKKNWHRMPTDTELSVLETVNDILKPLSYLTDALAGEKYVTASAVNPVLKHIQKKLAEIDTSLAKELKEVISSDLKRRYSDPEVCEILDLASFLDPRFKEQHLSDIEETKQQIIDQCLQYYQTVNVNEASDSPTDSSTSDIQVLCPAK